MVEAAVDGVRLLDVFCEGSVTCPWDLDGSGDVGVLDFLSLLAQWGTTPSVKPKLMSEKVNIFSGKAKFKRQQRPYRRHCATIHTIKQLRFSCNISQQNLRMYWGRNRLITR